MLHTRQLRAVLCNPSLSTGTSKNSASICTSASNSIPSGVACRRQKLRQRVRSQAFFDRVFPREERHAPELVKLDAKDEGGLGQTSAELFGPLASSFWLTAPISLL